MNRNSCKTNANSAVKFKTEPQHGGIRYVLIRPTFRLGLPVTIRYVGSQRSGVPRGGGAGGAMAPGRKPWRGRRPSL